MTTRRELTEAVGERYRRSDRDDKRQILDEFVELTGYHRKHAIRVLCREPQPPKAKPGPQRRYDDDVRAALITLWQAADRICGKRLKALIPTLIDSMTRHGHLSLPKDLRQRLTQISAATIDRLLRDVREQAFSGQRRRAGGIGNAIRRAVPIRTFTDWNDPLPGYFVCVSASRLEHRRVRCECSAIVTTEHCDGRPNRRDYGTGSAPFSARRGILARDGHGVETKRSWRPTFLP
jgi:hypothetical protein